MNNNPKARKKVLSICSWYPNRINPTLGNFVQKHNEAIAMINDVVVLGIVPDPSINKQEISEVRKSNLTEIIVYYPKVKGALNPITKFINFLRHRKAFSTAYSRVLAVFGQPDIVHLHITYPLGIYANFIRKKWDIPFVITEHSSGLHIGTNHSYPKTILNFCRQIFNKASFVLPVSEDLKKNIEAISALKNFRIISNVVDERVFISSIKKIPQDKTFLIHISSGVDAIKNLSGIIRVLSKIHAYRKDIRLDVVSDGNIEYAKELASHLNCMNVIRFHSTKSTEDIAAMLRQSDALLMFSNYENFPCVIAEAFMSGIPVISSNVNGIPEHVNDTNGYLVDPFDELALERSILKFTEEKNSFDPVKIRQYAIDHFSYETVSHKFDSVYTEVLNLNNL